MLHLGFSNFEGICLRCYSLSSGYCNFVLTVIFLLLVSLVLLLSWFRVSVSVVCIISWNFVVSHRYLSYFSLPIVEFSYLFLFSQRFSSCLLLVPQVTSFFLSGDYGESVLQVYRRSLCRCLSRTAFLFVSRLFSSYSFLVVFPKRFALPVSESASFSVSLIS